MKRCKRWIAILLSVMLTATVCGTALPVSAVYTPTVSVDTVSAVPEDTVLVNISIANNTALMALTVTFHYDPSVLTYSTYYPGLLSEYWIQDHGGYISFVSEEGEDKNFNGVLLTLAFQVKKNAPIGFYPITVKNIWPDRNGDSLSGCFACWEGTKINPIVVTGGVRIDYNGKNCNHRYGNWEDKAAPKCTEKGMQTRTCLICGHTENRETDALGHEFSPNWTVDRPATAERDGVMTRHCIRCDQTTDRVTFALDDAGENGFSNETGVGIEPQAWEPLREIMKKYENTKQPAVSDEPEAETGTAETQNPAKSDSMTADDLVENAKNPKLGFLSKTVQYLFGARGDGGIIGVIRQGMEEYLDGFWQKSVVAFLSALFLI